MQRSSRSDGETDGQFQIARIIYERLCAQIAGVGVVDKLWDHAVEQWREDPSKVPLVEVAIDSAAEILRLYELKGKKALWDFHADHIIRAGLLAWPAGVLWTTQDKQAQLGGHLVEKLWTILADLMQRATAAGTSFSGGLNHDLFARQMCRQMTTISLPPSHVRSLLRRTHNSSRCQADNPLNPPSEIVEPALQQAAIALNTPVA